jgi:MoaA/NifB/PqqE/SkfB family radical SAM enzyme
MDEGYRKCETAERMAEAGKVLTIETGYSCNAYCGFCPQVTFRARADSEDQADLSTEEILQRIDFGADEGYRHIGFSGGEPTIRPDFIEVVRHAKSRGFELIALTTNAMRLSYEGYAKALLAAGITSVNVSIHGATAKTHDGLMRTPGAFDLAIQGIRNVRTLAERHGRRVEMMSMCLAMPRVLEEFPDHIALMGSLGIRLHMMQPFFMNRANTDFARRMIASYDQIEAAIRAGMDVARRHGGHIKLFNTPVCLFWGREGELERQWKPLDIYRDHRAHLVAASSRKADEGYFRIEACRTCDEPCKGFRVEHYDQDAMVEQIAASVQDHVMQTSTREIWLGGLELLEPEPLRELLRRVRRPEVDRVVMVTAAIGRSYAEQFSRETLEEVDEVLAVLHHKDAGRGDHLAMQGNLVDLAKGLRRRPSQAPPFSAALGLSDLERPELLTWLREHQFSPIRLMLRTHGPRLSSAIPPERLSALEELGSELVVHSPACPPDLGGLRWEPLDAQWVAHPWTRRRPMIWSVADWIIKAREQGPGRPESQPGDELTHWGPAPVTGDPARLTKPARAVKGHSAG